MVGAGEIAHKALVTELSQQTPTTISTFPSGGLDSSCAQIPLVRFGTSESDRIDVAAEAGILLVDPECTH